MSEVFSALGFIALGMFISEVYNLAMWRKYREGLHNGSCAQQHSAPRTARYGGGRVQ